MKKIYLNCTTILLSAILLSNISPAQTADKKYPTMWVPMEESINRQKEFIKPGGYSKHKKLSDAIKKPETTDIRFSTGTFNNLLRMMESDCGDYPFLRVYIASYDNRYDNDIFNLPNHTLTVIFAPAGPIEDLSHEPTDLGKYYFIHNDVAYKIKEAMTKYKWVRYYDSVKMPKLIRTINITDPNNQYTDHAGRKSPSDTRSIYYPKENIIEAFQTEVTNQAGNGVDIKGIQLNFSSYTLNGDVTRQGKYKNRLVLMYEYLVKDVLGGYKIFYIDSKHDEYANRKRLLEEYLRSIGQKSKYKIEQKTGSDNGQLCPPNCPPPPPEEGSQL